MALKPFDHQLRTAAFIAAHDSVLDFSDPGTGKTASSLLAFADYKELGGEGRMLVFAPKSILETAWCDDCIKFTPQLSICAAYAQNRKAAFEYGTNIVVTNHDAATWVLKNPDTLKGFTWLWVDESTAYKNHTSQRSKAMAKISLLPQWTKRGAMTGTPYGNGGLLGLWHQVFIVDHGSHLGAKYYQFRHTTHEPQMNPAMPTVQDWVEKEGARDTVADILSDITIRHVFEECTDIPENSMTTREYTLPKKLRQHYDIMLEAALLQIEEGEVQAIHAAAVANKLLQIASGAVYSSDREQLVLDTTRNELVAELCAERDHTVVAFHWKHQRDGLIKALGAAGISTDEIAIIDGEYNKNNSVRAQVVRDFQKGHYRVILLHPRSAGHGLTLTRAATTIWTSPTGDAELWEQLNRRIYRTSQTRKTETILIQAKDTMEQRVYDRLMGRVEGQINFFELLQSLAPNQEAA